MDTSLTEHQRTFEEGNFIFTEEGEGDTFYIIKSGEVSLLKNTEDGVSQIGTLSSGDVLGEMALIDKEDRRSASARARTDVTVLEFKDDEFDQLLQNSAEFRQTVMDLLTGRLRNTSENLAHVLNLRDKIHEATILLLYFFVENGWLDRSRKDVRTDLPTDEISSYFRISEKKVNQILDNPGTEQLDDFSLDKRNELLDASEDLLERIFDTVSFEPNATHSSTGESDDTGAQPPAVQSLAEELSDFHLKIKQMSKPIDDGDYQTAMEQLEEYEKQFKRCRDQSEKDDVFSDIQSTIELIRDELNANR